MLSPNIQSESFILDRPMQQVSKFRAVAKRYRPIRVGFAVPGGHRCYGKPHDGGPEIVLFLTHGASFHKESWEPFLEDLWELQDGPGCLCYVTEAWAIDCPNHGEAAVVNEKELLKDPRTITNEDYANACMNLLDSGLIQGLDGRQLVFIGHSAGSITGILLASMCQHLHRMPFHALILVEPPMRDFFFGKDSLKEDEASTQIFAEKTKRRRDIWLSKEEAHSWFSARRPWATWDPRALDVFLEYGLRPLPTGLYPNYTKGVTLNCYRLQESGAYANVDEQIVASRIIRFVNRTVPIKVIFGSHSIFCPREIKAPSQTPDVTIQILPNGTHHVVQEFPTELARRVAVLLWELGHSEREKSRL